MIACIAALAGASGPVRADDGRLLTNESFAVTSKGPLIVDGGLVVALPSALPSGMSTGLGAGITRECSCWWAYGARASWSELSSGSLVWTVTHQEYRLRADAAIRHRFGRGTLALRLDLGPTIVHEDRIRNQSSRLMGDFESKAIAVLPAAELEAVVALHVTGPWLLVASGGPAANVFDGSVRGGWVAQLGIGWQP
jgi:hypothetical protein